MAAYNDHEGDDDNIECFMIPWFEQEYHDVKAATDAVVGFPLTTLATMIKVVKAKQTTKGGNHGLR
jgi:deoxyribose-phosphate aldolase